MVSPPASLVFEQLFDPASFTYTYLVGDAAAGLAALVDPVREQIERDLARLADLGLRLVHTLETHLHADHVTSGSELAARTGSLPVVSRASPVACAARHVGQGDHVDLGGVRIEVLETPGHTPESVSYLFADRVLTGDALLVGTCGRTDLQGGDAGALYDAVHAQLFSLPDGTLVFPAHDYQGHRSSTIGAERHHNARLAGRTRGEFITLMSELHLALPKSIQEALPANLRCGKTGE